MHSVRATVRSPQHLLLDGTCCQRSSHDYGPLSALAARKALVCRAKGIINASG